MLKLGLLLDAPRQERWVVDALRRACALPDTTLAAVVVAPRRGRATGPFGRLVDAVDHLARTRGETQFEQVDLAVELAGAPEPARLPKWEMDGRWHFRDAACERLRKADVDIWLCAGEHLPTFANGDVAGGGVLGLEIGEHAAAGNALAGADALVARSAVTPVRLVDYAHGRRVLHECFGATVTNSARLNRLNALHKATCLWQRYLAGRARNSREPAPIVSAASHRRPPFEVPRLAASLVGQVARNRWCTVLWKQQWQIAYVFDERRRRPADYRNLRYLVPPGDRFWADPMAVEQDGRHFILFEELEYRDWKGRLMAVEVFEDREPAEPQLVLEKPWHLSYPFVFRHRDQLYLMPESAENGRLELFRCVRFPDKWLFDRVLLDGVRAYDATLWQEGRRWWMFVSIAPPGAQDGDELHLYHAAAPTGPWRPHAANPVLSDARSARPAGPLFTWQGNLYRPSQDCAAAYGHAVVVNRVEELSTRAYRESPAGRISPEFPPQARCLHTVGGTGRLQVFDFQVRRKRWS